MMIETIVAVVVIAAIVGLAGLYVYKAKKRGQKCIGCPHAKSCPGTHNNNCSCGCGENKE